LMFIVMLRDTWLTATHRMPTSCPLAAWIAPIPGATCAAAGTGTTGLAAATPSGLSPSARFCRIGNQQPYRQQNRHSHQNPFHNSSSPRKVPLKYSGLGTNAVQTNPSQTLSIRLVQVFFGNKPKSLGRLATPHLGLWNYLIAILFQDYEHA
jgi:hypothetical protein